MNSAFAIKAWSAFAPGLTTPTDWLAWAADPFLPTGEATPALQEMPPLQRRRVDRLGRMALQVAWWCQLDRDEDIPQVFASRHGDLGRTYAMLRTLARDEPLSPTQFGLSTHNAIAAQYGIARQRVDNCICVAAGTAGAEAAVLEALGLLADGAEEVLVVVYDYPLPEGYADYEDEPEAAFAWALRVGRPEAEEPGFSLVVGGPDAGFDGTMGCPLPHALAVLRFLIGKDATCLDHREDGSHWRWQRHG